MSQVRPIQVIAVSGGKGGVGKSNISVNLSIALAGLRRRVVLMDADLGLANVDVLLGVKARHNIMDVLEHGMSLSEILVPGPGGIRIVPAASGVQRLSALSNREHAGLINAFNDLSDQMDVLVIDTAAGISETVISFVRASNEVIVVVCDEPSSITDAYALIKVLSTEHGMQRFRVVANMTRTKNEGQALFNKLSSVCDRFLDVTLQYVGGVPFDENVRKAVQRQRALIDYAPQSKAAQAMRALAEEVVRWPLPAGPSGRLEFFVERLLDVANAPKA
ncbi:MinD/ParA family protein [Marinimicrobium alkaliphilum]|uniref:MinD/ParA family protein n=1 Tax=Marinimicrobium alkaliphilum TaxID=2202654 RepID=UPI000DB935B6|nr:MinD/ParA family protein [Marinimicrobium alkaliphilum]